MASARACARWGRNTYRHAALWLLAGPVCAFGRGARDTDRDGGTPPAPDSGTLADGGAAAPLLGDAFDCGKATAVGGLAGSSRASALERRQVDVGAFPDALCDDGTPALFYVRPASASAGQNRWIIQLLGIGACSSPAVCAKRWCPRGQRVQGTRPQRSWETVSIIGAIRVGKASRLLTHRGAVNGPVFRRFVRTCLAPFIRPGDLAIMDNLKMHKSPRTKRLFEAAGGVPLYLPTYSPELNPIELLWAHLKRGNSALRSDAFAGASPGPTSRGGSAGHSASPITTDPSVRMSAPAGRRAPNGLSASFRADVWGARRPGIVPQGSRWQGRKRRRGR